MGESSNKLGDKIYELRNQKTLTQDEFARKVGVSRQMVSKWEAGTVMPKANKLRLISEILGVGLDCLMSNSTYAQPLGEIQIEDEVLAEVVADKTEQANEHSDIEYDARQEAESEKQKLSLKAKLAIITTAIVFVLVIGISLIVLDKIMATPDFEGVTTSVVSETWNFSMENIGWILFGISISIGVILGLILVCKAVKNKTRLKNGTNGDKPQKNK